MRRIVRAVALAGASLVLCLIWANPASAAAAVTVTPSSALFDKEHVTVHATGFAASENIGVCQAIDDGTPGQDDCDGSFGELVMSSPTGELSVDMQVFRVISPGSVAGDVNCAVQQCFIGVAQFNAIATTTVLVPITFAPGQPDAMSKRQSDGQIFGDNDYGGAGGRDRKVARGTNWTFAVLVQNDGLETDDITVTALPPPAGVTVHYFVSFFDVASEVTGRGFTFTDMAPGEIRQLAIRFDVAADAPIGTFVQQFPEFRDQAGANDTLPFQVHVT
jgi:hypothetical protein